MSFGSRLKQRRKTLGMTQGDLSEKIGISRVTISQIESDQANPSLPVFMAMVQALGTTYDFLLDGRGSGERNVSESAINTDEIFQIRKGMEELAYRLRKLEENI